MNHGINYKCQQFDMSKVILNNIDCKSFFKKINSRKLCIKCRVERIGILEAKARNFFRRESVGFLWHKISCSRENLRCKWLCRFTQYLPKQKYCRSLGKE